MRNVSRLPASRQFGPLLWIQSPRFNNEILRGPKPRSTPDSGWNGIEVYVNTRNKDMYRLLELEFQPRIIKALDRPNPDIPELLADVQAMLVKFDEAVSIFGNAAPLNPLYDD